MDMQGLGRFLIVLAVVILVTGLALIVLGQAGIGRLPGNLSFRWGGVHIFLPVVTMIVVSVALTIVLNVALRFFR